MVKAFVRLMGEKSTESFLWGILIGMALWKWWS